MKRGAVLPENSGVRERSETFLAAIGSVYRMNMKMA
jgi:hypothetical protein